VNGAPDQHCVTFGYRSAALSTAVAARPLGDLELRLPVFDLMATTFAPLARPHPMALEPFEGTEAEDAPDSPDPAASCSDVALLDGVWAEPIRTDILHR